MVFVLKVLALYLPAQVFYLNSDAKSTVKMIHILSCYGHDSPIILENYEATEFSYSNITKSKALRNTCGAISGLKVQAKYVTFIDLIADHNAIWVTSEHGLTSCNFINIFGMSRSFIYVALPAIKINSCCFFNFFTNVPFSEGGTITFSDCRADKMFQNSFPPGIKEDLSQKTIEIASFSHCNNIIITNKNKNTHFPLIYLFSIIN